MNRILEESLPKAFLIEKDEVIDHFLYGSIRVHYIFLDEYNKLTILGKLIDYNDSLKIFDAVELNKIKFKTFRPYLVDVD